MIVTMQCNESAKIGGRIFEIVSIDGNTVKLLVDDIEVIDAEETKRAKEFEAAQRLNYLCSFNWANATRYWGLD